MMRFVVADRLGKTLSEIDAMPAVEFVHWCAYLSKLVRKK